MRVELIGGPNDGQLREWPEDRGPIIVTVAAPDSAGLFDLLIDPYATVECIEYAYLRDLALPWRFVYQGERQRR